MSKGLCFRKLQIYDSISSSGKSLKELDILTMTLRQQPGENPVEIKQNFTFNTVHAIISTYTRNFIKNSYQYIVASHLRVRRTLSKTSTLAYSSENKKIQGSV